MKFIVVHPNITICALRVVLMTDKLRCDLERGRTSMRRGRRRPGGHRRREPRGRRLLATCPTSCPAPTCCTVHMATRHTSTPGVRR